MTNLTNMNQAKDDLPAPDKEVNWRDWVNLALLGIERSELPDDMLQAMIRLGLATDEQAPEEVVLCAAGAIHLLETGAARLPQYPYPLPEPAPEELADLPNGRAMRLLEAILKGEYPEALGEFLQLLSQHNKILPPESLPAILTAATADQTWLSFLLPAAGLRGQWLLQQHPAWVSLAPAAPDPAIPWAQLSPSGQADYWRYQRKHSAEEARQALQKVWTSLPPTQKAAILPALAEGLQASDEDFLEACLDDTRKEVRLPAATLLKSLPNSLLCQRLFERASACVLVNRQGTVSLQLPASLPTESQRDGIFPTGSKAPGGLPASWLAQHLAAIPPSYWEPHFDQLPEQIVGALARTHLGDELVRALTEAVLRHPSETWYEALIAYWLAGNHTKWWQTPTGRQVLTKASADTLHRLLGRWMDQNGPALHADHLASQWLLLSPHRWRPALSRLFWKGFREMAAQLRARPWDMLHYRSLLQRCAYHCDHNMLEEFRRDWSYSSSGYGRWDDDLEKMMQVLAFRKEMHAQFS